MIIYAMHMQDESNDVLSVGWMASGESFLFDIVAVAILLRDDASCVMNNEGTL
jgi:hypothetical protein